MAQTLYKSVARTVQELIMEVESGKLGLPELQRGYVWNATKVRELLDSMLCQKVGRIWIILSF